MDLNDATEDSRKGQSAGRRRIAVVLAALAILAHSGRSKVRTVPGQRYLRYLLLMS